MSSIYTYSVITSAAEAFKDKVPYLIALVEKDDGSHVLSRIEGYTEGREIKVGMPVEFVSDDEHGNPLFRLV